MGVDGYQKSKAHEAVYRLKNNVVRNLRGLYGSLYTIQEIETAFFSTVDMNGKMDYVEHEVSQKVACILQNQVKKREKIPKALSQEDFPRFPGGV